MKELPDRDGNMPGDSLRANEPRQNLPAPPEDKGWHLMEESKAQALCRFAGFVEAAVNSRWLTAGKAVKQIRGKVKELNAAMGWEDQRR